jgi:hypothetical protein
VDYFAAARNLSHTMQSTPTHIFIATDSVHAAAMPQLFTDFNNGKLSDDQGDTHLSQSQSQPQKHKNEKKKQSGFTVDTQQQYEQEYLSETWFAPTDKQQQQSQPQPYPNLWTAGDKYRYRTPHGSHTVAAGGGCHLEV